MYFFSTSFAKLFRITCLLFCLLNLPFLSMKSQAQAGNSDALTESTARYRVTFQSVWSSSTHPGAYPFNAHYSGLIGMTHNSNVKLFELGALASSGIISMAEFGVKSSLITEVNAAINAGTGQHLISGGGVGTSPGSVAVEVNIGQTHPLVSITSMIAPSPDWFIGVKDINLVANGEWVNQLTIPVGVYDAGSDSGPDFTSRNEPTNPKESITMITTAPLAVNGVVANMGNMIFQRIDGGNECIVDRVVTDNVATGNYNASQTITTSIMNPVEITTSATFKAGESIALNEGFHAKQGSIFRASIENCATNLITEHSIIESSFLTTNQETTPFTSLTEIPTLQIAPNPFVASSSIQFSLPTINQVSLHLIDANGRLLQPLIHQEVKTAGFYRTRLDASALEAGIYFVRLVMENQVLTEKVVLWR